MYQPGDSVTLNHHQMNHIIDTAAATSVDEAAYLRLYFNERLYLGKITHLKGAVSKLQQQSHAYLKALNESNIRYNELEKRINRLLEQVEANRITQYEKGQL